jgi:hypothetical protein
MLELRDEIEFSARNGLSLTFSYAQNGMISICASRGQFRCMRQDLPCNIAEGIATLRNMVSGMEMERHKKHMGEC